MRLLAIGKAPSNAPETTLFTRYAARIKPSLTLVEFPDGTGNPAEIKRREADALLAALKPDEFAIALDSAGSTPNSPELASLLAKWTGQTKKLTFIIGGAEGLDARIISRANAILSFGALTWPHMLARIMLSEQIFRAQAIQSGHPYHRAGRP